MIKVKKLILTQYFQFDDSSGITLKLLEKDSYWARKVIDQCGPGYQLWRKGFGWNWV